MRGGKAIHGQGLSLLWAALIALLIWIAVPAMAGPGTAGAAVSTSDLEHAEVENLFSVPEYSYVRGVSDDDRYVLLAGAGVYRYDTATGERLRVDVYADGTPPESPGTWARLSADGSKALSVLFPAGGGIPKVLIRYIDEGYTTVYQLPDPQPECGEQFTLEDATPDLSEILVKHYFGGCGPIGTHYTYRFFPDGSLQAREQNRSDAFHGELSDDGFQIFYATGGCAPEEILCSHYFFTVDRTQVVKKFVGSFGTSKIRVDLDGRGDGFASFTGDGSTFIYGSRLKNLELGGIVTTSELFALYRGNVQTGAVRYLTGSAGPPLRVDRQGRFALTLATVIAPDGTKTRNYAILDAWSHDLRVLDLQNEFGGSNLTGALSNDGLDRDLRYAFRIGRASGTPTLQRVSLLGDGAPACGPPDLNCDGWVRIAILGDSYISGEGAADGIDEREPPIEPAQPYHTCTDIVQGGQCGHAEDGRPHENKCHRSSASWAMRVATNLATGPEDVLFAACSGAITDDVLDRGQYDGLDGRPGPSPWGVFGGQRQLDALADFQAYRDTDVVLLSIGGNDIKFSTVVRRCLLKPCLLWPFSAWKEDAQHEAENIDGRVATTISAIREAADSAHVYVAGYPDPTGLEQCGATGQIGIDPDEQAWLRYQYIGSLNRSIEKAADDAGATYLPFEDAFAGHEICSELAYANGLKGGNDILKAIGNESFHPNAFGHRKLAQIAEPYVESLDGGLQPTLTLPVVPGTSHPALQVAGADGTGVAQADPGSTVILQGTGAPPNSSGGLVFNSLPTDLGTWSSNSSGEWTASSQIPQSASPGLHTIVAVDPSSGREIASTEVWVEALESCPPDAAAPDVDGDELPDACDPVPLDGPAADSDGDGVLNEVDNCAVTANPWQEDWDEDGLGEACDPDAGGTLEAALRSPANLPPDAPGLTLEAREGFSPFATIHIDGHDPEDPPATLVHRCSLDGEAPTVCTSPLWLAGLDLGTHRLEVTSGDPAGNLSPVATIDWEVTELAPPSWPAPPGPWTGNPPSRTNLPNFEAGPSWIYEFPDSPDAADCARLNAAVDRARRGNTEAQRRYQLARAALKQTQKRGPSAAEVHAGQARVHEAKRRLQKSRSRLRTMASLLSRSC